jgi:uncharacterized protein YjbI with pentapeptide repeats
MDYFNQNGGKKKRTKIGSNSLKSKKSGGNFGKKIINSVQKGGFSKSDFVGGNFYILDYSKISSIFYYLTEEGFRESDTYNFANGIRIKALENDGGVEAYIYLYNLYGTPGGYLEAVKLESITNLRMLTEFNFQNLKLTGSDKRKYNFQGANLKGANFANAILKHVHFNNAELENANFENAQLDIVDFSEANLKNANFENATLDELSFYKAQLQNANFENAELDEVDFSDAKLQNANFENLTLLGYQNVSFSDADLTNAKIELLEEGSDNTSMDIFKGAILEKADLRGTILESANLQGVNLKEANLQEVNLRYAILEGADLTNAKLERADLTGAKLEGAKIFGAIFTNAIINQELRNAINNKKPLIKSNDFISIPKTNNIYRRNKIAIPNNSSPNAIDYRNTLEKLANELYKHNILPLDKTEIIDKSVIHLLQTNYTESNKIHSHIKDAIKVVRIFLLRIQFQELEQKIMSNNF